MHSLGEGEYICPVCTIFGLEDEEVQVLIESGLKMTDHNIQDEGYEVEISAFKVSKASNFCYISNYTKLIYVMNSFNHSIIFLQQAHARTGKATGL